MCCKRMEAIYKEYGENIVNGIWANSPARQTGRQMSEEVHKRQQQPETEIFRNWRETRRWCWEKGVEGVAVNAFTSLSDDNEISPRLSVGQTKGTDSRQKGQAFTLHNKPDYGTVSTTLTIDCFMSWRGNTWTRNRRHKWYGKIFDEFHYAVSKWIKVHFSYQKKKINLISRWVVMQLYH